MLKPKDAVTLIVCLVDHQGHMMMLGKGSFNKYAVRVDAIKVYWLERQPSNQKVVCTNPVWGATTCGESCASLPLLYYGP